jgi:hypothetical protein
MLDPVEFGKAMAAIVKEAQAPLLMRIEQLESRPPERGADGVNGKDGASITVSDVAPMIAELVAKAIAEIPPPVNGVDGSDGKDADPIDVKEVVAELLAGDEIKTLVDLHVAEALPATVAKHFDANPVQHGKDGRDGAPGKDGEPGQRGADGTKGDPGRDGLDVKDLFRADGGRLVAVLSDGTTKDLGEFVGKDGKDGLNGKDGADFTECEIDYDGERTITIRSGAATITKTVPIPLDRGYYREGMASEKGDIVTHDGNAWIAQRDTKAKPCRESADWRMLARRGRDGRDGIDAKPAPGPVKLKGDGDA